MMVGQGPADIRSGASLEFGVMGFGVMGFGVAHSVPGILGPSIPANPNRTERRMRNLACKLLMAWSNQIFSRR